MLGRVLPEILAVVVYGQDVSCFKSLVELFNNITSYKRGIIEYKQE